MIAPEKCFQLYLACKTHFTTVAYDAVKHNARIKGADREHLEQRNDRGLFFGLAKKFDTARDCASFFVANFAYGNDYPIEDYDRALVLSKRWEKNRQSITKMFRDDVATIIEYNSSRSFDEVIGKDKPYPEVFLLYKNGKINVETLSILNDFENFVDSWMKANPLWKPDYLRIKKMPSFIKYNQEKIAPIIQELREEMNHA